MDEEKKPQSGRDSEASEESKQAVPDQPGPDAGSEAPAEMEAGAEPAAKAKPEPKSKPEPPKAKEKSEGKPVPKPAAKPAAKPAKPPVKRVPPKRPVRGPQYEDLDADDEVLSELQKRFPELEITGQKFLEQKIYTVPAKALFDVLAHLREEPGMDFDYLIDLTALDYLGDELRFCLVYQLYSYSQGRLIRIKSRLAEGEVAPSVTGIWKTVDWLEREIYDMFGVEFSGHPDLRRILLPEDWHGHPLRKDYDIKLQDQSWIRKHLRIRKVPE